MRKLLLIIVVLVALYYLLDNEGFRPYMLSNGLFANTDLEMVIDADYNWSAPKNLPKPRDGVVKWQGAGGCAEITGTEMLYDAMGIQANHQPCRDCNGVFVNSIGYQYKV